VAQAGEKSDGHNSHKTGQTDPFEEIHVKPVKMTRLKKFTLA